MRVGWPLLVFIGSSVVTFLGAAVRSTWWTTVAALVALGALAVHPGVTRPASGGPGLRLLRAGLVVLVLAYVTHGWRWDRSFDDRWTGFIKLLSVAALHALATACFAGALRPRVTGQHRWSRSGATTASLGVLIMAFTACDDVNAALRNLPPESGTLVGHAYRVVASTSYRLALDSAIEVVVPLAGAALTVLAWTSARGRRDTP
jgi:hypothetical protein